MSAQSLAKMYREWYANDRGRYSPDPFEMMDAAHECKHGNVPFHGCPEGCFQGEVRGNAKAIPYMA